jgi:hypothetical protein
MWVNGNRGETTHGVNVIRGETTRIPMARSILQSFQYIRLRKKCRELHHYSHYIDFAREVNKTTYKFIENITIIQKSLLMNIK